MRSRHPATATSILVLALTPTGVRAQGQPDEVIEIRGAARVGDVADLVGSEPGALDADRALAEPAFVTRVRLDARDGERFGLAELVSESVGATVRTLGGLGSFATLSVRGAAPGQTQVVVDGVPVSRLGSATVDLGRLELDGFALVELYRGGAPGHLAGAAGSALRLVSEVGPAPTGRPLRIALGAGSFGSRSLTARWLGGRHRLGWLVAGGYAGADGGFPYFDDRGTNLTTADDRTAIRRNAGFEAGHLTARLRRRGRLALDAGLRGDVRQQGIPGPGNAQAADASLRTVRQTADASLRRRLGARAALGATAYAAVELQRYRDRAAEIGLGAQDRAYRTLAVGVTTGVDGALGGGHRGAATVELEGERYDEDDRLVPGRGAEGRRGRVAAELSDDWTAGRLVLRPSLRLEVVDTRAPRDPDEGTGAAAPAPPRRRDRVVAPRLAGRFTLADGVALKGGLARYLRLPTALELFGDHGVVVGNPGLAAERGWSAELGAVVAPDRRYGAVDRPWLEVVGFAATSADTIVLLPTAALVVAPQNLGDSRTLGAELTAAARFGRAVGLRLQYTAMLTRQQDTRAAYQGKALPHRPAHRLFGRAELAGRPLGRLAVAWTTAALTAGEQLDPANLTQVPRRILVGAGVKLAPRPHVLVGVELENLLDARTESILLDPAPRPDLTRVPRAIADVYGYPLPGRALYLNLTLEP